MNYPEHEKLELISHESQAIGEFTDWLADQGLHLAKFSEDGEDDWGNPLLVSENWNIVDRLTEYFEIDQDALEAEKRQMLDAQRELNALHELSPSLAELRSDGTLGGLV